jgi:hypothetical protein
MKRLWRWGGICAVLIAVTAASVAIGAPSGGGDSDTKSRSDHWRGNGPPPRAPGFGRQLSGLADQLGVSESKLRAALASIREDLPRPRRGSFPPSRAEVEKRCTDLTDALGAKLGKSGDEVRAAMKAVVKADIEKAVDAKRLTRAEADKMLDRIDSAKCLPPLGPPVPFGALHPPGCGGHLGPPRGVRAM